MITRRRILQGLIAALLLTGCSDPEAAKKAAEDMGFTDVQITGYRWLGCDEHDTYHTGFTAKRGDRVVSGVVCSTGGWFKASTVRLD